MENYFTLFIFHGYLAILVTGLILRHCMVGGNVLNISSFSDLLRCLVLTQYKFAA